MSALGHIEWNTANPPETVAFLMKLFDWDFPDGVEEFRYGTNAGVLTAVVNYPDSKYFPGTTPFFRVDSIPDAVAKAEVAGATIILPSEVLPEMMGTIAIVIPPGNDFPIGFWSE